MILKIDSNVAQNMTRNRFEKFYFPTNLDFEEYKKAVCVPPKTSLVPIKLGERWLA